MTEVRYMISDVSRILDIPTNVLRYLEYCLSLNIKRTELGYRYYLQEDINLLGNVRILRNKGFHMKVIKSILPYIDKVINLDANKLLDLRERLEAALGLSGLAAQDSLKAQYGKVIDINMEEGDFVYKNPTTKQVTRLSTATIKTEEVKIQPIAQEVDNSKSCEEVAAAATDAIIRESHMGEETANPSVSDNISESRGSFNNRIKEPITEIQNEKKIEKKVTQIYDINKARPCHYMGAKKKERLAPTVKDYEKEAEKKVTKSPAAVGKIYDINGSCEVKESDGVRGDHEINGNHEVKENDGAKGNHEVNENDGVKGNHELKENDGVRGSHELKENDGVRGSHELKENDGVRGSHEVKEIDEAKGSHGARECNKVQESNERRECKESSLADKEIHKVDIGQFTSSRKEIRQENFQNSSNQILEQKSNDSLLKDSQDKIVQFREIMCSIVIDALRQNNHTLTNDINDTVTQSIVKEMDYMMRVREERQEERFRQLDRTIRETQMQRQQAAATKEGKKKKPSKFFQKNKVRI